MVTALSYYLMPRKYKLGAMIIQMIAIGCALIIDVCLAKVSIAVAF